MEGKIIKGIAGFYYCYVENHGIYECKAKGIFRNQDIKPLVGDNVIVEVLDEDQKKGNIVEVLERKNTLMRPNVANVDQSMIIFAGAHPSPNSGLLDLFLIMMLQQGVETIICINKKDLVDEDKLNEFASPYLKAGYRIVYTSSLTKEGLAEVEDIISNKTTVLAGPSGVGKSSILNILVPDANMEVGDISKKLKRGKHTTRHSEIFYVKHDTYIIDTPGFSSLEIKDIDKYQLQDYFLEFLDYNKQCRFVGCLHLSEPNCAVKEAVLEGNISETRYESYKSLLDHIENQKIYYWLFKKENTMYKLAPSILAANFAHLGQDVMEVEKANAEYLHIDVMDGAFVPTISFGAPIIKSLRPISQLVFDVHLMVEDPIRLIDEFIDGGADIITVHAEASVHLHRTITAIKDRGIKVGVSLNPSTPLCVLDYVLDELDMVLIMSVNPGYGGQSFLPLVIDKIKKLKDMIDSRGLNIDIQVDGGLSPDNVHLVLDAGANVIVAGSQVFNGNIGKNVSRFKEVFDKYEN